MLYTSGNSYTNFVSTREANDAKAVEVQQLDGIDHARRDAHGVEDPPDEVVGDRGKGGLLVQEDEGWVLRVVPSRGNAMSLEHNHGVLNAPAPDKTMLMFVDMFGSNSRKGGIEQLGDQLLVGVVEGEGSRRRGVSGGGRTVTGVVALGDEGKNAMVEILGGGCH